MAEIQYRHLEAVLNAYGQQVAERYKAELDAAKANASFNLKNTVKPFVEKKEDSMILFLALQDYWKYLEEGTGPKAGHGAYKYPPPFKVIHQWVKEKPIIPWSDKLRTIPLNQAQKAMAAMIRWSIYKHGTKPLHLLEKSLGDQQALLEKCREAIGQDIEDYARQVIDEVVR